MAFEAEGFCVVRGPDLLWGGDIRRFHPPAGHFEGVIGGPPCQAFSRLRHIVEANGYQVAPNMIPEFERVVAEAEPSWFLMENVPAAPEPEVGGYAVHSALVNNRAFGSPQNRERRFSFGSRDGRKLDKWLAREAMDSRIPGEWDRAVVATSSKEGALAKSRTELRREGKGGQLPGQNPRRTVVRCAELQGLDSEWAARFEQHAPFTKAGMYKVIGNGVPLTLGRAVARAVKEAMGYEMEATDAA